jgi:hypothetical protein
MMYWVFMAAPSRVIPMPAMYKDMRQGTKQQNRQWQPLDQMPKVSNQQPVDDKSDQDDRRKYIAGHPECAWMFDGHKSPYL